MQNIDKMRPIALHDRILLIREKSGIEFFLKNNENFVSVNCPACEQSNEKIQFVKYGYFHLKCSSCKSLYVSPRPTEKMLFDYYDNYEAPRAWNDVLVETNDDRKYLQHMPRARRLKDLLTQTNNKKNKFVDLGAGNGNFSKAVQELNIFEEVVASDISEECIQSCLAQGLNVKKGSIIDFEDESIDCITFNDLIEHVFSPRAFIGDCFKKLKRNGILMLSTPNGEGFDFKILGEKTENITPPEHIQYFNPQSIKILLEELGFEVLDISTPGILDFSIIKRQVNEKFHNLKTNNDFLDFLVSLNDEGVSVSFQNFLTKNNLSSHMLIFAKKKS